MVWDRPSEVCRKPYLSHRRTWGADVPGSRLDKYYMLVRRFVNATMQLLQRDGWEPASIAAYNAILSKPTGGPLS